MARKCPLAIDIAISRNSKPSIGLPLIDLIDPDHKSVQALILVPTRELAIQVSEEINSLKGDKNLRIVPIYGGQSIDEQLRRLKKGVHIGFDQKRNHGLDDGIRIFAGILLNLFDELFKYSGVLKTFKFFLFFKVPEHDFT